MPKTTEKKKKSEEPEKKEDANKKSEEKEAGQKREGSRIKKIAIIVLLAIILIGVFYIVVLPSNVIGVPFPTFKSNYYSSQRAAFVVVYGNQTQLGSESSCYTALIQSLAHNKNASTIDFYIMNKTLCTFPVGSLGGQINVGNSTTSACLSKIKSESTIFLNYSNTNSTLITAYKMYVLGNSKYMSQCPIAVSMS